MTLKLKLNEMFFDLFDLGIIKTIFDIKLDFSQLMSKRILVLLRPTFHILVIFLGVLWCGVVWYSVV